MSARSLSLSFRVAHAAEQLVERHGARRVAREARLERALAGCLVSHLERQKAALLPEGRSAGSVQAPGSELAGRADPKGLVARALGAGAQALPGGEVFRASLRCLLERRARRLEVGRHERRPTRQRARLDRRVVPEDPVDVREGGRAAPRIAPRRRQVEIGERVRQWTRRRRMASARPDRCARRGAPPSRTWLLAPRPRATGRLPDARRVLREDLRAAIAAASHSSAAGRPPPTSNQWRVSRASASGSCSARARRARSTATSSCAPWPRAATRAIASLNAVGSAAPPDHAIRAMAAARPRDPSGAASISASAACAPLASCAASSTAKPLESQYPPIAAALLRLFRARQRPASRIERVRLDPPRGPSEDHRRCLGCSRGGALHLFQRGPSVALSPAIEPGLEVERRCELRVVRGRRGLRRDPRRRAEVSGRAVQVAKIGGDDGIRRVAIGQRPKLGARRFRIARRVCPHGGDQREAAGEVRRPARARPAHRPPPGRGFVLRPSPPSRLARTPRARVPARLLVAWRPFPESPWPRPRRPRARSAREGARHRAKRIRPRSRRPQGASWSPPRTRWRRPRGSRATAPGARSSPARCRTWRPG